MTLAAEPVLNGSWPGYFWTEDGDHVPGRLVLENGSCLIETVQEVVSLKDYAVHSSNPHMGESPDQPLYGHVRALGKITCFDVRLNSSQTQFGVATRTFRARYLLIGIHYDYEGGSFSKSKFRIRYLEHWAARRGLSVTVNQKVDDIGLKYVAPDDETFDAGSYELALSSSWNLPSPEFTGTAITTTTWIQISEQHADPMLHRGRFALPMSALLTLTLDHHCPVVDFQLFSETANAWIRVVTPDLEAPAVGRPASALITLSPMGLPGLARWFDTAQRMGPVLPITEGGAIANDRAIEGQILELATAAEGFHRRKHDGERRLSPEDVEETIQP